MYTNQIFAKFKILTRKIFACFEPGPNLLPNGALIDALVCNLGLSCQFALVAINLDAFLLPVLHDLFEPLPDVNIRD